MNYAEFEPQFCIVHITDLHFDDTISVNYQKRAADISKTIENSINAGIVLLLFTGDTAFSGKKEEYVSASLFFDALIEELNRPDYQLKVFLLPGNHDVKGPAKSLQGQVEANQYDSDIKKMNSFFEFAGKYGIQFTSGQPEPISFEVEGVKVSVCGLNSAPLSTLCGDDKGFHTLPHSFSGLLDNVPSSGFHIVASHHGPEWFRDDVRLDIEKTLSNSVDFALFGHEHMGLSRSVCDLTERACTIVRGGAYSLCDDLSSSYKVLLFRFGEFGSYDFVEKTYTWSASEQLHTCTVSPCSRGNLMKSDTYFRPRQEYIDGLFKSEVNSGDSLSDVFVFPPLKEEIASGTKEGDLKINSQGIIADINTFMEFLAKVKTLEIHSEIRAGKSSLLKAIYLDSLSKGYSPVLLTQDNSTGSITKTLRAIIREQYGESPEAIERFNRIPREKVLLLVDDFNLLKRKVGKDEVIASMLQVARNIVLITDTNFQFKLNDSIESDFRHLEICPWTKSKRDQLIRKRCCLSNLSVEKADELIAIVDKAVHSHFQLFEMTPPFINQYVDFYLYEPGVSFFKYDLPFTSIMTTNVRRRIRDIVSEVEHLSADELARVVIVVLKELALRIHADRKYNFTACFFSQVAQDYLDEYGIPVKAKTIIDASIQSEILTVEDSGYEYRFASRSLHAFFVARAIDLELDRDVAEGKRCVSRLLNELDYSLNEEILVLLENTRFIPSLTNELLDMAAAAVNSASAISPIIKNHKCLSGLEGLKIKPPSDESAGAVCSVTDEMEQKHCKAIEQVNYAGVYEYQVPEKRDPFQSAMIAIKYAAIAGRCLDQQQTMVKELDKARVREQIYSVTGMALDLLLTTLDGSFDKMCEELSGRMGSSEDTESKVKKLLSMCVLAGCIGQLDSVASDVCGRLNVYGFSNLRSEDDFYSLFMLNIYLRSNDEDDFCRLAKKSIKEARSHTAWPYIVSISLLTAEYIIYHPHMRRSARDSLIETVFNGNRKAKVGFLKLAQA